MPNKPNLWLIYHILQYSAPFSQNWTSIPQLGSKVTLRETNQNLVLAFTFWECKFSQLFNKSADTEVLQIPSTVFGLVGMSKQMVIGLALSMDASVSTVFEK